MANSLSLSLSHFFILCSLVFFFFSNSKLCLCFKPKNLNSSTMAAHWSSAGGTWYGEANGAGSDGGSCGYRTKVSQPPFSSMITAVSPSLYNFGRECGACYQVKCTSHPSCSGRGVRVIITDSCPGCQSDHFDLSGTSFGAMAITGQEDRLRAAGILQLQYERISCDYSGKTIAFTVDLGSNPNYLAVVVEFEEGDGDLAKVELKEESSGRPNGSWRTMQQSWGAVWKLDAGSTLKPPLSIRLTSQLTGKILVARNVIPVGWKPGATYHSFVNYL